jgi:hypothetical protein
MGVRGLCKECLDRLLILGSCCRRLPAFVAVCLEPPLLAFIVLVLSSFLFNSLVSFHSTLSLDDLCFNLSILFLPCQLLPDNQGLPRKPLLNPLG